MSSYPLDEVDAVAMVAMVETADLPADPEVDKVILIQGSILKVTLALAATVVTAVPGLEVVAVPEAMAGPRSESP